jgi:hypothetical protein
VRDLLEEAAAAADRSSPLRAALLGRLSIELYYGPPSVRERLSEEAVANGRRTGGRALLEALGARHVALWSPDHVEERLAIADELVAAARSAGDREAELQGVNWRVVDLLELGDMPGVLTAIETHARLADELRLLTYAWYAPMWRAMLAVLGGRIDEAERLVEESARIGEAAHDENAALLLDMERFTIRVAQRRLTPADHAAIEARARSSAAGPAWRSWLAVLALERGDTDEAARRVSDGAAELDDVAQDANWLYAVTTLGLAAALLDDGGSAARIYPRILPYADRAVVAGRGTNCTGSVALSLGLLAAAQRDDRAAAVHLARAAAANDRLGATPYAAAARSGLATVLGRLGEHERAASLRAEALAAGDKLGMTLPDDIVRLL